MGHSARPCFGAIQRQTTSTPVVEPGPDRRPITAVVAVGLTLALGLGALARRALSRR